MTPFTEAEVEAGRLLFARECDFIIGAAELSQLPDGDRLEICFAGRSNVGKSSLINALTGRKSLARASNTPYLSGRASLRRCFLLIDSRHGIKPVDTEIMDMLDAAAVSYQTVLTKADKVKAQQLDNIIEATAKTIAKRPAAYPQLIVTSAEKQEGIEDLRAAVARLAFEQA